MTTIAVSDLTQATLSGTGIFDVLMRANAAHLESEFAKGRIKGPEYSTVYLGSLTQVMQTALQLLLTKDKTMLEADLLTKQIALADKEILKATATIAQLEAQTLLINQQKANAIADSLNIPKQGLLIDANKAQTTQQTLNLTSQKLQVEAQTALTTQQKANAVLEGNVLVATECKLKAEFDVLQSTNLKTTQETGLLAQKTATERAQVTALGVDDNSVVGRQKQLYQAQTSGFTRDAEQKAAKVLVDTWNVRRTTDPDSAPADTNNNLNDAVVGRVVTKLLAGVGA
jgi:hypothetical protein